MMDLEVKLKKYLYLFIRSFFAWLIFLIRKATWEKLPPPIPTSLVIIGKGGKTLCIRRTDGLGITLPGGIVNWQEDPQKTAVREVQEETGLRIKLIKLLGIVKGTEKGVGLNSLNIIFQGEVIGGKVQSSSEGEVVWLGKAEIKKTIAGKTIRKLWVNNK